MKLFLERGIFYYDKFLSIFEDSGEGWYVRYLKGELLERLGKDQESLEEYLISHEKRPDRGEPLVRLFWYYYNKCLWDLAFDFALKIKNLKCPIENDAWQIEINAYYEHNWRLRDAIAVVFQRIGSKTRSVSLLSDSLNIFKELKNEPDLSKETQRLDGNIIYVEKEIGNMNEKEN